MLLLKSVGWVRGMQDSPEAAALVYLWVTRCSWRSWLTRFAQRQSSVLPLIGQGSAGDEAGPAIQEETKKQRGKKKKRLVWDLSVQFNLSARRKQGLLVTTNSPVIPSYM